LETIHLSNENRYITLSKAKPCVMAIGFFDGVHLGHQKVIKEAKKIADEKKLPLIVMSFFPHPKEVLSNGKKVVPYLMPMSQKQQVFKRFDVDIFYLVQFTKSFASLSPKQFVKNYLLDFQAKIVVAGFDFTYGYRGEGNMDRICADSYGEIEGIKVDKVAFNGEKISSTLIRSLIGSGEMEKLPHYLGEFYQIEGNIRKYNHHVEIFVLPNYLLPKDGMYEVKVVNGDRSTMQVVEVFRGKVMLFTTNGGRFPFVDNEKIRIQWTKQVHSGISSLLSSKITV
jgi:riboflavin kinase / FMN adenylyltransferase